MTPQVFTHQPETAEACSNTDPFLWDLKMISGSETEFNAITAVLLFHYQCTNITYSVHLITDTTQSQ